MTNTPKTSDAVQSDAPVSEDRRAALRAIGKYTTLGAGASLVVLSSSQAVKAQATSPGANGCANGNRQNC